MTNNYDKIAKLSQKRWAAERADEINWLHSKICAEAQVPLGMAIRIGKLLTEQKDLIRHERWLPWLNANVAFNGETADKYIGFFERQGDESEGKESKE